MTKNSTALY